MPASSSTSVYPRSRSPLDTNPKPLRGVVADEGDAFVAQGEQMPRRNASPFDIIGTDRRNVCTPCVDEDDRNARFDQTGQIVGRWRHRQHEQSVGAITARQRGEVLVAMRWRLDVEQHEVVAAAVEGGDDSA